MNEQDVAASAATRAEPHAGLAGRLAHLPDERGPAALPVLRAALQHPDPWVRVHAIGALAGLGDADACAALTTALHDDSFGVHWTAARALAAAGRPGVEAVLRALLHDTPAIGFLHGAMHVLRHAALLPEERVAVAPVLDALHRPAADLETPVMAEAALARLGMPGVTAPPPRQEPWYRTRRDRHGERGRILAPATGTTAAGL